jgi:hypothetical protein
VNESAKTSSPVPKSSSDTSSLKGKILMVLSPEQYQEELNVPRDYFQDRRYSVFLGPKGVAAKGMNGDSFLVDLDLDRWRVDEPILAALTHP